MHYFYSRLISQTTTYLAVGFVCLLTLTLSILFGANVAYGQVTQGQLLDVRKQLNQIQQKLIKQEVGRNNTSAQRVGKNTSQYDSLFSQDSLQRGDRSQAVKDLQVALNSVPNLVVSESGPGSVGEETRYFGAKTHQAVIAFQNRYKNSILQPLGLREPTGVVGSQTKNKLRDLIGGKDPITKKGGESFSQDDTSVDGESNPSSKQDTSNSNQPKSLSELRNQFTLNKWSFTREEKQTIYDMMPPEVQDKHFSNFLDKSQPSPVDNNDSTEPSTNPLQQRYQDIQESNETSLKEWLKGYLALQKLREPLSLLQRQMGRIFGPQTAYAQGPLIFGGRIASVEPCPAPPNALQVTVAGPRPGRFAYIPGASQIRPVVAGVPKPGASTLGNYAPVPGCYTTTVPPVPTVQGTIILIGVSV